VTLETAPPEMWVGRWAARRGAGGPRRASWSGDPPSGAPPEGEGAGEGWAALQGCYALQSAWVSALGAPRIQYPPLGSFPRRIDARATSLMMTGQKLSRFPPPVRALFGAARPVSWWPCPRLGRRLPTSPQTSIVFWNCLRESQHLGSGRSSSRHLASIPPSNWTSRRSLLKQSQRGRWIYAVRGMLVLTPKTATLAKADARMVGLQAAGAAGSSPERPELGRFSGASRAG